MLPDDKWVEIDVDAINNNLNQIKGILDPKVKLIAVVKANSYGHGAVEVAQILNQSGVDFFAVTFLDEALKLRKAGVGSDILLFSPLIYAEQVALAINNHITVTITSSYDSNLLIQVVNELKCKVNIHLKIDTGLGRFGLREDEIMEVYESLQENPYTYIEGIYTHMANATHSSSYTWGQFNYFTRVINKLAKQGYDIPIKHCANSAVFLKYPEMHLDAVRIGTLLSGQHPVGSFPRLLDLDEPFKFKSRVISIRTLAAGSYLGYYRTYRLKREAKIAVIPVGFSDGLALEVANKPAGFIDMLKYLARTLLCYMNISRFNLQVIIKGKQYPVRGKVFMQMALIEIPSEDDVNIGDEVEVPIRKTLISESLTRIYIKEGKKTNISALKRNN